MAPSTAAHRAAGTALRTLALMIVVLHGLVAVLHGLAHLRLGISLSTWQSAYVGLVIGALPLLAALRLLACRADGYPLLAISMLGSLAFGVYYHFLAPGPDHVGALSSAGPWPAVFAVTAWLLALMETAGVWAGVNLWLAAGRPGRL